MKIDMLGRVARFLLFVLATAVVVAAYVVTEPEGGEPVMAAHPGARGGDLER